MSHADATRLATAAATARAAAAAAHAAGQREAALDAEARAAVLENAAEFCSRRARDGPVVMAAPVGIERGLVAENDDEIVGRNNSAQVTAQTPHEPCSPAEAAILTAIRGRRKGNGVTAEQLGAAAGVSERQARAVVAHLRHVHREPLCSSPARSFYWPARLEELDEVIASLTSRCLAMQQQIAGLREGGRRVFGTIALPGMAA
jgi:hypothetical protein